MGKKPIVSVVIPCFNAEEWIRESLESAVTQGLDDIEVIVVDDGSTDKSAEIIEKEFPDVRLIKTENNGPSKTRNLLTQLSQGEFIQYLDADDLLAPGKLRLQLQMLRDSGADVAYGDWQKLIKNPDGKYVEGEQIMRKMRNPEIDLFTDFWCPPAVYLFRRAIVEKVGNWNEGLSITQDARFTLDCALQGARFTYCPGIMAYYRVHSFGESMSTRDPVMFVRCCLQNAIEVEHWWGEHGGITESRKEALLKVYCYVARASYEKDRPTFEDAYRILNRLNPGYIPKSPSRLRFLSRLIGYRQAEAFAVWYRVIKRRIFR